MSNTDNHDNKKDSFLKATSTLVSKDPKPENQDTNNVDESKNDELVAHPIITEPDKTDHIEVSVPNVDPLIDNDKLALDEVLDQETETDPEFQTGFIARIRNIFDFSAFDTLPDSSRKIIITILALIIIVIAIICCTFSFSYLTKLNGVSSRSSSNTKTNSTITTVSENGNLQVGLWGDLPSSSSTSSNSGTNTKEEIRVKKTEIPYDQRSLVDLSFDTTEDLFEKKFSVYRQKILSLNDFNYSSTNKAGSTFMSSIGFSSGIISTISGKCPAGKCQINNIVSKVTGNTSTFINSRDSNYNYVGCNVQELENTVNTTFGNVKLFKVVCFNSAKFSESTSGFLLVKYTYRNAVGLIEILGPNDLDFTRNLALLALEKLK